MKRGLTINLEDYSVGDRVNNGKKGTHPGRVTVEDVERLHIKVGRPEKDVVASSKKPKERQASVRQNAGAVGRVLPVLLEQTRRA